MNVQNLIEQENVWKGISALIMILIFINSSMSVDLGEAEQLVPHIDKILHFITWTILSFCLIFSFHSFILDRKQRFTYRFLAVLLIAICYGLFDEVHQFFVPTRTMDFYDFLTDAIGSVTGGFLGLYFVRFGEEK